MNSVPSHTQQSIPGVESKTSEGFLPVEEGHIFWKLDVSEEADESRPTLFLIHSALTDHTAWDAQVVYLNSQGWSCVRTDLFGYKKSWPSEQYLRQHNRSPFDAIKQLDQVRQHVLGADSELILVGLSIGASLALGYTLAHPQHVDGLVLAAGGLRGFEFDNDLREEALFDHAENLIGDVHGLANLLVRIWGDGPLQDPGRLADDIVDRMLKWNIDIASREGQKVGGNALDAVRHEPPPIARLHTIDVPTAVAWGVFDESYTTAAMKYVANHVEAATSKEFKTAHMINLESPDEFNRWLNEWLQSNFET